jgi:hypothetical protein
VSYAMFSGGGLAWAEQAMKRGEFAVPPANPGERPDLSGLSCRFAEIPATRGLILSLVVVAGGKADAFRALIAEITALVERSPDVSRPVPPGGPPLRWPPAGLELEARATRNAGDALWLRRAVLYAVTATAWLILRFGIKVGGFVPQKYINELVENSDFRKYDDALRMVLDCTPAFADALERRLAAAASAGVARYGVHRQRSAMLTCFAPSPMRSDHIHFVDGADGGYALAASALKGARG